MSVWGAEKMNNGLIQSDDSPFKSELARKISVAGVCGRTLVFQTKGRGSLPRLRSMRKTKWEEIPYKFCLGCDKKIKKRYCPSWYVERKYCSRSCQSSALNFQRYKNGWKSPVMLMNRQIVKPDLENLNKLFNRLRNYSAMARELGISYRTIQNWMPRKRDLLNPAYYRAGRNDL